MKRYKYLDRALNDYFLLRQILLKQYEHCKLYPDDIKTIRYLYGDYPETGYGSVQVQRFIRYNQMNLNAIILNRANKKTDTDLFKAIYSYGYGNHNKQFMENIKNKIVDINNEIIFSFKNYYDFENNIVKLSSFSIEKYFEYNVRRAIETTLFNRNEFEKSDFFKTYGNGFTDLSVDFNTYDIKMNQDFWDRYINNPTIISEFTDNSLTSNAGVDR